MAIGPANEKSRVGNSIRESIEQTIVKLACVARSGVSKICSWVQWLLIAAWLLVLYALALWLVLGTLTSFHFQTELAVFGSKADVLKVIKDQRNITIRELQLRDLSRDLSRVNAELSRLRKSLSKQELQLNSVSAGDEKQLLQEQINNTNVEIGKAQERKVNIEKEFADIKAESSKDNDPKSVKIRELADDFLYMKDSWGFETLILMPKHLLVLILTISMGALGSVIHLTWEFFDLSKKKNLTWYIFRPFLGGILAFAIFILVKSGQMFVSSASPSGGSAEGLNPFFISFLAIVSGMLSEQAYTRISAAGSNLLAPPIEEVRRYVRKNVLSDLLRKQNKSAVDLVRYVQEPQARVTAWFTEQESLSEHHQEIVAAWLGVAPRDLFTDLKAETDGPEGIVDEELKTEDDVEEVPETRS